MRRTICVGIAVLVLSSIFAPPAGWSARPVRPIQGVWFSPDWILPGTHPYSEGEVRGIVRATIASLKDQGINTIFMETFYRGSSIASGNSLPMVGHLRWNFDRRGSRILDTLQIVIDEAGAADISVHAWSHLFYWRMDNDDVFKPWQRAVSIWDDLLVDYLIKQTVGLRDEHRLPELQWVLREMASSIRRGGVDGRELSTILHRVGYESGGHPFSRLIHELLIAGCSAPDFLLVNNADDPFPRTPDRTLRPIYLNPASPAVRERILKVLQSISEGHTDLAGIHLDHARFPTDGQGIPLSWEPHGREPVYFNKTIPSMALRYRHFAGLVAERRTVLTSLVNEIRVRLHRGHSLSAAVLPLYYVERSDGIDRFNGYDYSGQDWHSWNVDFVVPMMYGFDPWRIRTLVRRFDNEAQATVTSREAPSVIPGISKLQMAQAGLLGNDNWVFFDLTLGLDAHYVREHDEDYNWRPLKDM